MRELFEQILAEGLENEMRSSVRASVPCAEYNFIFIYLFNPYNNCIILYIYTTEALPACQIFLIYVKETQFDAPELSLD